jgi:putative MATE family efflux protein
VARLATNQSFVLALLVAGVMTVTGAVCGPYLGLMAQLEPESAALAARYWMVFLPAIPFLAINNILVACLRGAGDMVSALWAMGLVNIINITVSSGLLLGWGPFPMIGWDGLAVGTAAGHFTGGLFVILLLVRGRAGLKLERRFFWPNREMMRRIVRIGVPGGSDALGVVACQLTYVAIINRLGDLAAAAHGVAIRIESLSYLPGRAFQLAATTLVGQNLGAGRPKQATETAKASMRVGSAVIVGAGVGFFIFSRGLAQIFINPEQEDVVALCSSLLKMVAFVTPPMAVIMIIQGVLQGAGDTRWPLVVNTFGMTVVRLPLAWYLAHTLGYGVKGAYVAMLVDLIVRASLLWGRFTRGAWRDVQV